MPCQLILATKKVHKGGRGKENERGKREGKEREKREGKERKEGGRGGKRENKDISGVLVCLCSISYFLSDGVQDGI